MRIRGYIVLVTSFCPDLFGKPQHHNYLLCVEWQFVDVVCVYVKLGELVMHGVYSKIGRGYRGEW